MSEISSPSPQRGLAANVPVVRSPTPLVQIVTLTVLAAALVLVTLNVWMIFRWVERQQGGTREHAFWVICHPGFPAEERKRAFSHLALDGNKEWRSANLEGLDLTGIALPGADLRGATFRQSTLAGADLSLVNFSSGSFELADLGDANLSQADLSEARLLRTVLKKANLRRAKLRAASLEQVQGENADLMVADLSDANCLMANLTGAKLDGANFSGATLESAILKGASLLLARLDGADLKNTDFTDANWWRARGLSADQIELLKARYPPTAAATQIVKDDYLKWLGETRRN